MNERLEGQSERQLKFAERRERYLGSEWSAYPSAPIGAGDVADFIRAGATGGLVCGRLTHIEGEIWHLSSGGQTVTIELSPNLSNEIAILQTGDIVALELRGEELKIVRAVKGTLLAPAVQAQPSQNTFTFARSQQWSEFLMLVRGFFLAREFTEAQTPTLVPSPGTEPHLQAFSTERQIGSETKTYFLPTSPEFHLKKMLARGWTRLFEFKTCFRNGEKSEHHQPEFLMLEWYRAYARLDQIENDVQNLLFALGRELELTNLKPHELKLEKKSVAELFAWTFKGFRLTPLTTREELVELAKKFDVSVDASDTWDEVFHRLFLEKIERDLGVFCPLIVHSYPPSQAALARLGADGFAERFELYWRGFEIANAFHELNDPVENEARFQKDLLEKKQLGLSPVPVDEELLKWIRFGLPPSGGIALGLDRLFMAFYGLTSIAETRAFPG